jgi:hypothetical protein
MLIDARVRDVADLPAPVFPILSRSRAIRWWSTSSDDDGAYLLEIVASV